MILQIADLVRAAGGEIYGKVRLQKIVYLLDQIGMNSGLSFDYHHYGPYSFELANQVDAELAFGQLTELVRRRVDGVPYSVFGVPSSSDESDDRSAEFKPALTAMQKRSATVLELSATIHWLINVEKVENWHDELVSRKGAKADSRRIDEAVALLSELGLKP